MDRKTQDVYIVQKDLILFRKFVKNVKEEGKVRFDKPFTDKKNIKKYVEDNGITDIVFGNCIVLAQAPQTPRAYERYLVQ